MNGRTNDSHGIREGVAKCISQACVYSLEARKTLLQVHGRVPRMPMHLVFHRWMTGILTSSVTSGLVFGTYFTVYNNLDGTPVAGPLAALTTSAIKVPISNGMRLMQSGHARNLLRAGKKIVRAHTWKGLYGGYRISLLEDIIEFDLRARVYKMLCKIDPFPELGTASKGLVWGAVSGALTAGITTPFDTIKSHIARDTADPSLRVSTLRICKNIWQSRGASGFFRGVEYRLASNMVKSALFFTVYELLP